MNQNSQDVSLFKMSGAGNTFALVDARSESAWLRFERQFGLQRAACVQKICDAVVGIKVDGVLFIEDGNSNSDFTWDFYNSDGSGAEMCGNAARCAAQFCSNLAPESLNREIRFQTEAGIVTTRLLPGQLVQVRMPEARVIERHLQLRSHSSALETFEYVNTGVPHLVQKIHTMADLLALKEMAREMRSHAMLGQAGANVTFYVEKERGLIEAATYERGVEDYTLACGTGAVAAAKAHSLESEQLIVRVEMPGGNLTVEFQSSSARPLMTGQALLIGEFKYNLEVLK